MLIATLLIAAVDDAKAALDRFASLVKKNPAITVDLQVQLENYPSVGRGQFCVSRPDKAQLKVDWGEHSYEFVANGPRRIEIDHFSKIYLEFTDSRMPFPPGEVSMTPEYAFPSYFVSGDLRHLAPGTTKFKADRKIVQGSSVLTPVSATFNNQTGVTKLLAYIDQNGKLTSLKTDIEDQDGHRVWTVTFSNYRLGTAALPFSVAPPRGYSPDRLQSPAYALEMGEAFPWSDWRNASSGAALSGLKGKPILAVYVRSNCEPSKAALKELASINAAVSKTGTRTVLLVSGAKAAAQSFPSKLPRYYGATANAASSLRSPGTPTFYLIDKQGKLARLWFGFDRDRPKLFSADIIAAAKEIR